MAGALRVDLCRLNHFVGADLAAVHRETAAVHNRDAAAVAASLEIQVVAADDAAVHIEDALHEHAAAELAGMAVG